MRLQFVAKSKPNCIKIFEPGTAGLFSREERLWEGHYIPLFPKLASSFYAVAPETHTRPSVVPDNAAGTYGKLRVFAVQPVIPFLDARRILSAQGVWLH